MSTLDQHYIDKDSEQMLSPHLNTSNVLHTVNPVSPITLMYNRNNSEDDAMNRSSCMSFHPLEDSLELHNDNQHNTEHNNSNDKLIRYSSGANRHNHRNSTSNNTDNMNENPNYSRCSTNSVLLDHSHDSRRDSTSTFDISKNLFRVTKQHSVTHMYPSQGMPPNVNVRINTMIYDEGQKNLDIATSPLYPMSNAYYYDVYGENPNTTVAADAPFIDMCGVDELPPPPSKLGATWRRLQLLEQHSPEESTATSRNEMLEFDEDGKIIFDSLSQTDTVDTTFTVPQADEQEQNERRGWKHTKQNLTNSRAGTNSSSIHYDRDNGVYHDVVLSYDDEEDLDMHQQV